MTRILAAALIAALLSCAPSLAQYANYPTTTYATVGTSSASVVGNDPQRRGIIFINPGSVTVYLTTNEQAAVVGKGIPVEPGAKVTFLGDASYIRFTSGFNAIAASGSSNNLTILELH